MRRPLGAVEPLNVPQASPDLTLLHLSARHLLLFLGLELHVASVFDVGVSRTCGCTADITASNAAARSGVLEAVERHSEMAFVRHAAVGDVPLLGTQCAHEFLIMGDHNDATFVLADGYSEATQRITVQEIGGFVQDEQMRVVPHGTCEDDLNFLAAAEAGDLVVVGNLGVKTNVFEVLGDYFGLEDAVTETFARCFVIIKFLDKFCEAPFEEGLARDLAVEFGEHMHPFAVHVVSVHLRNEE